MSTPDLFAQEKQRRRARSGSPPPPPASEEEAAGATTDREGIPREGIPREPPTQHELVLRHLRAGKTLTSLEAVKLWNMTRLGARVYELRQEGWPIKTERVKKEGPGGRTKQFARYYLPEGAR